MFEKDNTRKRADLCRNCEQEIMSSNSTSGLVLRFITGSVFTLPDRNTYETGFDLAR